MTWRVCSRNRPKGDRYAVETTETLTSPRSPPRPAPADRRASRRCPDAVRCSPTPRSRSRPDSWASGPAWLAEFGELLGRDDVQSAVPHERGGASQSVLPGNLAEGAVDRIDVAT